MTRVSPSASRGRLLAVPPEARPGPARQSPGGGPPIRPSLGEAVAARRREMPAPRGDCAFWFRCLRVPQTSQNMQPSPGEAVAARRRSNNAP